MNEAALPDWNSRPEPWRSIGLRARADFQKLSQGETVRPPVDPLPVNAKPRQPETDPAPAHPVPTIASTDIAALRIGLKYCKDAARRSLIKARIAELNLLAETAPGDVQDGAV